MSHFFDVTDFKIMSLSLNLASENLPLVKISDFCKIKALLSYS